ncbi:lytic transglycosylase domain-containing protein [Sandaracinobacteroides saxicola]|uniref:Lytic transglycosylase domain-containing protein n=1 Tax=Sandaracinobacteroides saxicola TaxID=2759707 RepID=A0A7G5IKR1_9SPHN|nr:lytic transglycosylase domain-containing protein [Sandaracinobacteroides saxicola]QMW23953.1 lytic transglycosylase domain-containing protein [Sandaracinobacteroides saxicola]
MPTQPIRPIPPLRLLLAALTLAAASPAPAQDPSSWLMRAFVNAERGVPPDVPAPDALSGKLATWDRLRAPAPRGGPDIVVVTGRSGAVTAPAMVLVGNRMLPLIELATFAAANPAWPATATMRARAERAAADPQTPDDDARAVFTILPPQTAAGRARLALLTGDLETARAAWRAGSFDPQVESALLTRFGGILTRDDHIIRADRLLWLGATSAAARLLPLLPDEARALTQARIALRNNAPDAEARAASVPAAQLTDPGLLYDRAVWLVRQGQTASARALLANSRVRAGSVTVPELWLKQRLDLARPAMREGDARTAWRLLANHNSFALGRPLAERSLAERQAFTDVEWLAGWLALRRLNQPQDAIRHFSSFRAAVLTPVSQARGDYWLGRAAHAFGDPAMARAAFDRAASHPDFFYGQLASEFLGRAPALPQAAPPPVSPADRSAFNADELVRATRLLTFDRERQSLFLRALADSIETPAQARLATELAGSLSRPDLAVRVARASRASFGLPASGGTGVFGLTDPGFPRLDNAALPSDLWLISHAIARQESFFDRTAISSVGARGLMQLMPGTAADVARKLGLPYDPDRLFSDPGYNLTLGSSYYGQRLGNFDGSHLLAIAAYNAGAGNVRRWLATLGDPRGRPLPEVIDWVEMIPFSETRNYVQRVIENAAVYSMLEPRRPGATPRASQWLAAPTRGGE